MYWVYILSYYRVATKKDPSKLVEYIGLTNRLFRRLIEHCQGRGGANTSDVFIEIGFNLIGLYKVEENMKIMRDDLDENISNEHDFENYITELCMKGSIHKTRGGKYTRTDVEYDYSKINNYLETSRPNCDCGMPADVFKSAAGDVYFRCSLNNAEWLKDKLYHDRLEINDSCQFLRKYKKQTLSIELEPKFDKEIIQNLPVLSLAEIDTNQSSLFELPTIDMSPN